MKLSLKYLFICTVILCSINNCYAQKTKKERKAELADIVKKVLQSDDYFFSPSYANSSGGSFSVLSTYYLKISKDSIAVYLPYYGLAQTSGSDVADGSIVFTWTSFDYTLTEQKNGNWKIMILPKNKKIGDMKDAQSLTLMVSADGSASLQVLSTNRNPINFDGSIGNRY